MAARIFTLFLILCIGPLSAETTLGIPEWLWNKCKPHLLPPNSKAKKELDNIFRRKRAIANKDAMQQAGFQIMERKSSYGIYVASHKKLKRHLIKCVLDDQPTHSDIHVCFSRIDGAEIIKKTIQKHNYSRYFKVPKKWIYILPETPSPAQGVTGKKLLLVVEKFDILQGLDNRKKWQDPSVVTKPFLDALYRMLSEAGLGDSIHLFNIPFCKDGKVGFIDTEHVYCWPVRYENLQDKLPEKRRDHWMKLILENN